MRMHSSSRTAVLAIVSAMGFAIGAAATGARAAYIATLAEVGSDVVATGTGSINTAGLTFKPSQSGGDADTGYSYAKGGILGIGPATWTPVDKYTGITGPAVFGTTGLINAATGSGDMVELAKVANVIDVPFGYVSGSPLSGMCTFANRTFTTMGVTPGVHTWTWGSGATADSYTLMIGTVPEPASLSALGFAGAALLRRRRGDK
jgi:hypothetical protein